MSVGFCTAVSFKEPQTASQKLLGFADSYLSLGCKKVEIVPGFTKDGKEAVINDPRKSSYLVTALKIVSYLTVILPLLALITKIALRCCTHRFYLLDSKQAAEEVLKKMEAGKPLSNDDLKFLPLSRLTEDQFASIFDPKAPRAKILEFRERFAFIPATEVAETVYNRNINIKNFACLVSENQYKSLNISISESAARSIKKIITRSSINPENIPEEDSNDDLNKLRVYSGLKDQAEVLNRIQSRIASIDPDVLEDALFNYLKDKGNFYHYLPDQQLMKLKISKFTEEMIKSLIEGLAMRPSNLFGYGKLTEEEGKENLRIMRRRFALLDINEINRAVSKNIFPLKKIAKLASDSQFKALRFSKMDDYDFGNLFRTEERHKANSKRLFKLMPHEEREKAILDGRIDQDMAKELNS